MAKESWSLLAQSSEGSIGQEIFVPVSAIQPFFVTWDKEGHMIMPQNLPPGQKSMVLVTRDESTFGANDGKRRLQTEDGKQPRRPRRRVRSDGV